MKSFIATIRREFCFRNQHLFARPAALLVALLLSHLPVCAQNNVQTNRNGIEIRIGNAQVELVPVINGAFRLSVAYDGTRSPSPSSFLADIAVSNPIVWEVVRQNGLVGIRTKAGQILIDPHNGDWTLLNAGNQVLIPLHGSAGFRWTNAASDALIDITYGVSTNQPFGVYGCGNGNPSLLQTEAVTHVANGIAVIPYYWSPAGYAVLAVSGNDNLPAGWHASANGRTVTWGFPGNTADLYLMPAANMREAAGAYAALTGRSPVPPRWAFGYLQSRWGWTNQAYIEDTLREFRERKIPVDAFIYDFEWYTTKPDYEVPPEGVLGFSDFNWNTNLFPEPTRQIKNYQDRGVRFVGIRKPRLGNAASLAMVRDQGWALNGKGSTRTEKFQSRDVDFANPQFREWYIKQTTNLLAQGVDGWWNDEGEGAFTTYYYWNVAEAEGLNQVKPGHRLWTLNRAFSPGMQRLGTGAWTGDIQSTWRALVETPTSLLNWSLAGMPYGGCDIGGYDGDEPSPEMLTRWMEAGVFFPIMRSHSALRRTPRFPWLFGPEAESAIRKAINLRYRLIPYYYSLAYETHETGIPIMRPLLMEFPNNSKVANVSDQWLMGPSLMAAPILQPGGKRSVYMPDGTWYLFGTNTIVQGDRSLDVTATLDQIPLYVRAGTILPLGPVIQNTGELPGGTLEVQVYPGADTAFTLVEDDGETTDYLRGQVRRTTFRWNDKAGRLSWQTEGPYKGKNTFKNLRVVILDPKGSRQFASALTPRDSP